MLEHRIQSLEKNLTNFVSEISILVRKNHLSKANELLKQLVESAEFRDYVLLHAKNPDYAFLNEYFSRFKFIICPDIESLNEEPDSVCQYGQTRFLFCVTHISDIVAQFLHIFMHEYCRTVWPLVREPKNVLDPVELDFFEDVFGSVLIGRLFKSFNESYYHMSSRLIDHLGMEKNHEFRDSIGLFSIDPKINFLPLKKIRDWLIQSENILEPAVFIHYMKYSFIMRELPEFRYYLNFRYQMVEAQKKCLSREVII